MNELTMSQRFLDLAAPEHRHRYDGVLRDIDKPNGWARLQQAFLAMIDDYVDVELRKPVDAVGSIDKHEAGGQWRIAFPHMAVRGNLDIVKRMADTMTARRSYTDGAFYHGYPDCQETHHEIETFIYFQNPLSYLKMEGSAAAVDSIEDLAHHVGNWCGDCPPWYDWQTHGFVSTWLGTRSVRNYRPYDYQEANHWRHMANVMAAYFGTGKQQYLDVISDYAATWCAHIERQVADRQPIRCSILPAHVKNAQEGYGRYKDLDLKDYKVFYSSVAANTAYDVVGVLLDLYRVTGERRYLWSVQAMIDHFYANGHGPRPAVAFTEGSWISCKPQKDPGALRWAAQDVTFITRLSLRHDMVTGLDAYRDRILAWAAAIDEENCDHDCMVADLMVAAHYYSGDPKWLARGYAMALRAAAVAESDDHFHQCNSRGRQGSKFLMELLYQPLLGGCEWGTRGNIPVRRLNHACNGSVRLPQGVSLRYWRNNAVADEFEAVNHNNTAINWKMTSTNPERDLLRIESTGGVCPEKGLHIDAGGSIRGKLIWSPAEQGRLKPQ